MKNLNSSVEALCVDPKNSESSLLPNPQFPSVIFSSAEMLYRTVHPQGLSHLTKRDLLSLRSPDRFIPSETKFAVYEFHIMEMDGFLEAFWLKALGHHIGYPEGIYFEPGVGLPTEQFSSLPVKPINGLSRIMSYLYDDYELMEVFPFIKDITTFKVQDMDGFYAYGDYTHEGHKIKALIIVEPNDILTLYLVEAAKFSSLFEAVVSKAPLDEDSLVSLM